MALPKSYLTSAKKLPDIFNAIRSAQAPERFTQAFLESLEFKSTSDRLMIGVLKALGFLDDSGRPTDRYYRYLDQSQSEFVLAEGIREAYQDLFRVNINAQDMSKQQVINKFKTLSQGKLSDAVLDKMAMTFTALVKLADFSKPAPDVEEESELGDEAPEHGADVLAAGPMARRLGGLVYNIQIVLPESRDPAVYDALFHSLKRHIL